MYHMGLRGGGGGRTGGWEGVMVQLGRGGRWSRVLEMNETGKYSGRSVLQGL